MGDCDATKVKGAEVWRDVRDKEGPEARGLSGKIEQAVTAAPGQADARRITTEADNSAAG